MGCSQLKEQLQRNDFSKDESLHPASVIPVVKCKYVFSVRSSGQVQTIFLGFMNHGPSGLLLLSLSLLSLGQLQHLIIGLTLSQSSPLCLNQGDLG